MLCKSLNGKASGRAAPPAVSGHPSHSAVGGGNRGCALIAVQLPCRGSALAVAGCVRTQRVTVARAGGRADGLCQRNLRNCCSSERQSGALTGSGGAHCRSSNRKLEKKASKPGCSSCRQLFLTLHQLCCNSCSLFVFFS